MNQSAPFDGLRFLDCYPEMFSEMEQRQVDGWICGGLVVKTECGLLNITEAGARAYWSQRPEARSQEVIDVLDENIMGVLENAEHGLSLEELATRWSGGVLFLSKDDVLSAFKRWREGRWKYGCIEPVAEHSRFVAVYQRLITTSAI
jgi:hypothetical protein